MNNDNLVRYKKSYPLFCITITMTKLKPFMLVDFTWRVHTVETDIHKENQQKISLPLRLTTDPTLV